jgi:hypothetical protein
MSFKQAIYMYYTLSSSSSLFSYLSLNDIYNNPFTVGFDVSSMVYVTFIPQ